jgi:hypothetical protein
MGCPQFSAKQNKRFLLLFLEKEEYISHLWLCLCQSHNVFVGNVVEKVFLLFHMENKDSTHLLTLFSGFGGIYVLNLLVSAMDWTFMYDLCRAVERLVENNVTDI